MFVETVRVMLEGACSEFPFAQALDAKSNMNAVRRRTRILFIDLTSISVVLEENHPLC